MIHKMNDKDNLDINPLVTFVLISYNQEKYIREAIESTLAQDYSPLEIILSDDCSTDNTFKIMQEMAFDYKGNAKIVLNKNNKNLNIGGHIKKISENISGEIVVMAAGDDISHPQRSAKIVEYFLKNPRHNAVYSDYSIIDDEGKMLELHHSFWNSTSNVTAFSLIYGGGGIGTGATYAYRKNCFFWPEEFPENIHKEDRILPWRAYFLGGVGYLNTPLIKYRESVTGVSRLVSVNNIPACKKNEHIEELIKILWHAQNNNMINKLQYYHYLKSLKELVSHMYKRDFLEIKLGIFGKILSRLLKLFFARHFIFDYFFIANK